MDNHEGWTLGKRLTWVMNETKLRDKQVAWALKVTPGLMGQWRR